MASDVQCLQTANVVGSTINPETVQACKGQQRTMLQSPTYKNKMDDVDRRLKEYPGMPLPFVFLNGRALAVDEQTGMITGFRPPNSAAPDVLGPCTQATPCELEKAICSQM